MSEKIKVAILFGGRSGEHDVSLMSAESVMNAIDRERFEPIPIGITRKGRWVTGPRALHDLKSLARQREKQLLSDLSVEETFGDDFTRVPFFFAETSDELQQAHHSLRDRPLVVFPVLHGPFGEDGTIQGLLELMDLPYVGSGVAASAAGMDKVLMKELFRAAGLPIIDHLVVLRRHWRKAPDAVVATISEKIGFPCFVKPANLGSSVGISKVNEANGLPQALDEAAKFDRKIVVEKGAVGFAEVECSVLGNDEPQVSIPGEIVPSGEFYDYKAKYIDDASELIIPARISPEATRKVQELSVTAYQAIDAAGLARVDFFVHPETDQIYVNEINTMPGFTPISMYPKLWEASGIPYKELISRLIDLAFERHREKKTESF